jgi:hypothetical protein
VQADLDLAIRSVNEGHVHRFLPKPWDGPRLRQELRDLILGDAQGDPGREEIAQAEERLRGKMPQDPESGAFLLDEPEEP